MEYQDFEIEISSPAAGAHTVNVIKTPAGETRQQLAFGFSDEALRERLSQLERDLRYRDSQTREQRRAQLEAVKAFGGSLFEALISDNLKSLYDQSRLLTQQRDQGLRLKLRLQSPLLAAVPWELLYDGRYAEFVCTSRQVSLVRYVALPRAVQLLATKPPLNVLGVVSAPQDLPPLDVAREKRQVEEALRPLLARGTASLTWLEQPNWRALLRAMRQGPWHVLHYVGHSDFDAAADEGYLSLEDSGGREERLSADRLGTLLADHGTLRLVLLNSCKGAQIGQDIFSSTATTLVRRGIPAVIGMQYDVSDAAALEFALTFYETLAENVAVETAVAEARKAISLAVDESAEWGTPVFYTHAPESVLFDMQTTPPVVDRRALEQLADSTTRSFQAVDQVDELVATVRRLTPQLKKLPDAAAYGALVAALDEVVKTWQVSDEAFAQVWQLYDAAGDLKQTSKGLLDLTNYKLQRQVDLGRGHCHKIAHIYSSAIRDWIYANSDLSDSERAAMDQVFLVLGQSDDDIFYAMVRVAAEIEATAEQALGLVEDDRAEEARTVAKELRRTLSPLRTAINRSLVVLEQLQAEFIALSTPVPPPDRAVGATPAPDQETLAQWHALLIAHFDLEELKTLCFHLGIDYDVIGGEGKAGKVRELLRYLERRGDMPRLKQEVMVQRPRVSWPDVP